MPCVSRWLVALLVLLAPSWVVGQPSCADEESWLAMRMGAGTYLDLLALDYTIEVNGYNYDPTTFSTFVNGTGSPLSSHSSYCLFQIPASHCNVGSDNKQRSSPGTCLPWANFTQIRITLAPTSSLPRRWYVEGKRCEL